MVFTEDTHLPTEEELTVQEINVSGAVLRASAHHLGKACEYENNEFMLCRSELQDPRKCLNEGKAVTSCALKFFRLLKNTCYSEFTQYANCVDKSSGNFDLTPCRKTQSLYDKCVLDNMGIERPPSDYFARIHVHDSKRPKPPVEGPTVYPDATPYLPEDYPRTPAKYGSRFHWLH